MNDQPVHNSEEPLDSPAAVATLCNCVGVGFLVLSGLLALLVFVGAMNSLDDKFRISLVGLASAFGSLASGAMLLGIGHILRAITKP